MKLRRLTLLTLVAALAALGLVSCSSGKGFGHLFPFDSILPQAKFAFIVGDSDVGAYSINNATGAITAAPGSPFGGGILSCPDLGTANPAGTFLFVEDACNDNIRIYGIDQTNGALAEVSGSGFAPANIGNLETPLVHPNGHLLYVSDNNLGVHGFTIDAAGALTEVAGSPFPGGGNDEGMALTPSGRYLYLADGNDPLFDPAGSSITAYSINTSTGVLTPVPGSPFALDHVPHFLAIDPTSRYLYASGSEDDTVIAFIINPSTGALTKVVGSPFAAGGPNPQGIRVTPDGHFLYVTNNGDNPGVPGNVGAFKINSDNGKLTPIAGSPFTAGGNPKRLSADPSSEFLYVTNEDEDDVSVFTIDPTTGVIRQVPGSPFPTNIGSEGITITSH